VETGLNSSGTRKGPFAGSCEYGNETLSLIEGGGGGGGIS